MIGKVAASNIIDPETKEVLIPINKEITEDDLAKIMSRRHKEFRYPLHRQPERQLLSQGHAAHR